jgi:hypothetical protein
MSGVTWTDIKSSMKRIARDNDTGTTGLLEQDYNTGYHLFNAKLARYYTRKQQFTDIVAQQSIYQTPVDCIRITGITSLVGGSSATSYSWPLKEVSSEFEWRKITSYKVANNWPTWYMSLGHDKFQVWPVPSQDVTNGFRLYYQPQDVNLTIDDVTSTSTVATVTVTNGSTLVTATSGVFTQNMRGLSFQVTGVIDDTFYLIDAVPTNSTLTLKSAFVGYSGSLQTWRIGQLSIIPSEYIDAPMHYALGNYFMSKGNTARAQFHLGTPDNPGLFYSMQKDCKREYASSTTSSVITTDTANTNVWQYPPNPAP